MQRNDVLAQIREARRLQGELAKRTLSQFSIFLNDDHESQWFQRHVYGVLDDWIAKRRKKVAIFMPPQHGKSTMSSIETPAKILGENPKAKIVVASYSDANASKFNRKCQDIIDSARYRSIYPGTVLPAKGIETTNELRNNTFFETVGQKGYYKAVSIGGSLTGFSIDYGVIDDPIKDRKQANSKVYRDALWDWYVDVFCTRLHNDSCQLLLFTRWHQDDLAGRLFDPNNEHYDPIEAAEWTIIVIPAIKETGKAIGSQVDLPDPREIGEALWESKHSREKMEAWRRRQPQSFASLGQQRPAPAEGNMIKREWFAIMGENELPFNPVNVRSNFWIDGAFTDKMENDESAHMHTKFHNGTLYIFAADGVRKELNEYLAFIVPWLRQNGYKATSQINIEMKASGWGFYSMLKQPKYGGFNCVKIPEKTVRFGKLTRVQNSQPTLASGKVVLVRGPWNARFIDQCANFPNDTHDDMLDLLCYAVHEHFVVDSDVYVNIST